MNVLIIEPDRILAAAYKRAFDQAAYQTRICNDAQTAVALIDKLAPDAVILELQLAGHSGIEFLHEFRSYDDWAEIPVFIYSKVPEYRFKVEPATWQAFGVRHYFYKPEITVSQLIGAIKEATTP
jgi:DNA-binding response OmpR family regulator